MIKQNAASDTLHQSSLDICFMTLPREYRNAEIVKDSIVTDITVGSASFLGMIGYCIRLPADFSDNAINVNRRH